MKPNMNFENENYTINGLRFIREKRLLDELKDKFKVIDQREYDYAAFIITHCPKKYTIRRMIEKGLRELKNKVQLERSQGLLGLKFNS